MKIYMDNRGNERALPLEHYLDGECYDKLYIRKNKVNLIEFSEAAKELKFSFSGSYNIAENVRLMTEV